jgi:hypothetical protein
MDVLSDRRARKRAAGEWRNSIQRETLMELQDTAYRLVRFVGVFTQEGPPGSEALNAQNGDISHPYSPQVLKINLLEQRILDDEVRRLTTELREAVIPIIGIRSKVEGEAIYQAAGAKYVVLNERIGVLLRELL